MIVEVVLNSLLVAIVTVDIALMAYASGTVVAWLAIKLKERHQAVHP